MPCVFTYICAYFFPIMDFVFAENVRSDPLHITTSVITVM